MSGAAPFHPAERAEQERQGTRATVERYGSRAIRDFFTEEHQSFFEHLNFIVVGARDSDGQPWASLLAGAPGFLHHPDDRHLRLRAELSPHDPAATGLRVGSDLALLGIDLSTRRRNRANGIISQIAPSPSAASSGVGLSAAGASAYSTPFDSTPPAEMTMQVEQSYGNCPQHITVRHLPPAFFESAASAPLSSPILSEEAQALIRRADTFFIASGLGSIHQGRSLGLDVSHRGGPPGFVRVLDERRLSFPDYSGNGMYNTVGNLIEDPRAGLLFIDFESGTRLQISAQARIAPPEYDPPTQNVPLAQSASFPDLSRQPKIERQISLDISRALYWPAHTNLEPL